MFLNEPAYFLLEKGLKRIIYLNNGTLQIPGISEFPTLQWYKVIWHLRTLRHYANFQFFARKRKVIAWRLGNYGCCPAFVKKFYKLAFNNVSQSKCPRISRLKHFYWSSYCFWFVCIAWRLSSFSQQFWRHKVFCYRTLSVTSVRQSFRHALVRVERHNINFYSK